MQDTTFHQSDDKTDKCTVSSTVGRAPVLCLTLNYICV